jgi:hypothetical protein
MTFFIRTFPLALGILALYCVGPAFAQENLDSGKTGAQLYASDCAICHKTPAGLTKNSGIMGLDGFLREHYTASRESAGVIAAYLQSVDKGPAPSTKRKANGNVKGDEKPKSGEKGGDKKPVATKGGEPTASETKPSETKPSETKPTDTKPPEAKAKDSESKPSEPKAGDTKPSDTKN